jgi:hypothetical protein
MGEDITGGKIQLEKKEYNQCNQYHPHHHDFDGLDEFFPATFCF